LPLGPGRVLGNYELFEELGQGGMGVVYRARRGGQDLALKVLPAGFADAEDRERFVREAAAAGQLLDRGGTLSQRLRRGALEPREAARLMARVARTIAYAHERGVVHRDIKPGNILLTEEGAPKVSDFGLARFLGDAERLTQTGTALGTPHYMAPEQARGEKEAGSKADVYGLAATLYHAVCGRQPFVGQGVQVLDQVLRSAPPRPRSVRPDLDPGLERILLNGLAKSPAARTPSANAFAEQLEAWGARGGSGGSGARSRVVPAAVVSVLVVAGATAGGAWLGDRLATPSSDGGGAPAQGVGATPAEHAQRPGAEEPQPAAQSLDLGETAGAPGEGASDPEDRERPGSESGPEPGALIAAESNAPAAALLEDARALHAAVRAGHLDPAEGLKALDGWLAEAPEEGYLWFVRGSCALRAAGLEAALRDWARAEQAERPCSDPGLQVERGRALFQARRYREAHPDLRAAGNGPAPTTQTLAWYGIACREMVKGEGGPTTPEGIARLEESAAALERALEGGEPSWQTPFNLAGVYASLLRHQDAERVYQEAAERVGSGSPWPRLRRCDSLLELQRLEEAVAEVREVAATFPPQPGISLYQARILHAQGASREALPHAEAGWRAVQTPTYANTLVRVCLAAGERERALEVAREAVALGVAGTFLREVAAEHEDEAGR
jgi:tetratricopeptide (TPR) repeat protein